MKTVEVVNYRNTAKLEEELNELGKGNDYSMIEEEARELAQMPESLESGLLNVRKDYEKDSIICIFHVVELEDNEEEEKTLVELSYYITNHYS
ncbi:hypothetical protein [Oceanobacillus oncorhynchi]|uniref:hypothetical protein n=1 Tax=Oceanobacillus oncorhynchi TaxID=545501 RepID=UPI0034D67207